MTPDNATDFADALEIAAIRTRSTLQFEWPEPPRIEAMVAKFRNGILELLTS